MSASSAKSQHPPTICNVPALYQYVLNTGLKGRETEEMRKLRLDVVEKHHVAVMSAAPDESVFLAFMANLCGWKKAIEVGAFLGYTTLALAQTGCHVTALDVETKFTDLAKPHWEAANVSDLIDLKIAPAAESMESMLAQGQAGTIDFVFIDADKSNYDVYYELGLKLLRPGGVIGVDNTLWDGDVINPEILENKEHSKYPDAASIHALNIKIASDDRVDASFLTIADGLTLVRKR